MFHKRQDISRQTEGLAASQEQLCIIVVVAVIIIRLKRPQLTDLQVVLLLPGMCFRSLEFLYPR
jgi:hypothetical protein